MGRGEYADTPEEIKQSSIWQNYDEEGKEIANDYYRLQKEEERLDKGSVSSDAQERVALREDMRNIVDYMKQSGYLGQNEEGYSNMALPGEKDYYLPQEGLDHLLPEFWFGGGRVIHRTFRAGKWVYERLTDPKFQIDHSKNKRPEDPSRVGHVFSNKDNHLKNTPENWALLESVCRSSKNYYGRCRRGHDWYAKIIDGGKQVFVKVRNGIIESGGINPAPRPYNKITGFSRETRP